MPPRKKRRSSSLSSKPIPNGFKDVFGSEDLRRMSKDTIINADAHDREYKVIQVKSRPLSSSMEEFSDFSKNPTDDKSIDENDSSTTLSRQNISKFGDKKSDRFFGENLSDCLSDEKVDELLGKDFVEEFIARENLQSIYKEAPTEVSQPIKTEDRSEKVESMDRKAEFLMAMLTNDNESDDDRYMDLKPVEEPPMIVIKRNKRCMCCDDEESLRKHLQRHEIESEEQDRNMVTPPRKPSRDLDKYRKSLEMSSSVEVIPESKNEIEHQKGARDVEKKVIPEKLNAIKQSAGSLLKSVKKMISPQKKDDTENMRKVLQNENKVVLSANQSPESPVKAVLSENIPTMKDAIEHFEVVAQIENEIVPHQLSESSMNALESDTIPSTKETEKNVKIEKVNLPEKINKENLLTESGVAEVISDTPPQQSRPKRISREDLPSPPPRPKPADSIEKRTSKKKSRPPPIPINPPVLKSPSSSNSIPKTPSDNERSTTRKTQLSRNISMPSSSLFEDEKFDKFLKKCNSSNSFLTPEMMAEIMKKTQDGYGMIDLDYWGDICHDLHDGSGLVSPSSKLQFRKISTTQSNSSVSIERTPDITDDRLSFSIGTKPITVSQPQDKLNDVKSSTSKETESATVVKSSTSKENLTPPDKVEIKIESIEIPQKQQTKNKLVKTEHTKVTPHATSKSKNIKIDDKCLDEILESGEINIEYISPALENIYKSNKFVLDEFEQYIEENLTPSGEIKDNSIISIPDKKDIDANIASEVAANSDIQIKVDLIDDSIDSNENQDPDSEQKSQKIINKDHHNDDEPVITNTSRLHQHQLIPTRRRESIDDVDWFKNSSRRNSECPSVGHLNDRRGSIVEVDEWFAKPGHSSLAASTEKLNSNSLSGSDAGFHGGSRRGSESVVYDTRKLFPFGSAPLSRTKSESSDFFENRSASVESLNSKANQEDHSKLLEILQRENPEKK